MVHPSPFRPRTMTTLAVSSLKPRPSGMAGKSVARERWYVNGNVAAGGRIGSVRVRGVVYKAGEGVGGDRRGRVGPQGGDLRERVAEELERGNGQVGGNPYRSGGGGGVPGVSRPTATRFELPAGVTLRQAWNPQKA